MKQRNIKGNKQNETESVYESKGKKKEHKSENGKSDDEICTNDEKINEK